MTRLLRRPITADEADELRLVLSPALRRPRLRRPRGVPPARRRRGGLPPRGGRRGQEPAEGVVDVGMGVGPDLTGRGVGTALLPQILALVGDRPGATTARAAVAAVDERSLALCRSAGFREVRAFTGPGDRPFRELVRPLR